jgi:hypothetical protein
LKWNLLPWLASLWKMLKSLCWRPVTVYYSLFVRGPVLEDNLVQTTMCNLLLVTCSIHCMHGIPSFKALQTSFCWCKVLQCSLWGFHLLFLHLEQHGWSFKWTVCSVLRSDNWASCDKWKAQLCCSSMAQCSMHKIVLQLLVNKAWCLWVHMLPNLLLFSLL